MDSPTFSIFIMTNRGGRGRPRDRGQLDDGVDKWDLENFDPLNEMDFIHEEHYRDNPANMGEYGSSSGAASIVSNVSFLCCAEYHHIGWVPKHIQFQPVGLEKRCCTEPRDGWLSFSGEHIRTGLQFPLPVLLLDLLHFYGISLTQLSPNAIRFILAFIIKCFILGIVPSTNLFRYFFQTSVSADLRGFYNLKLRQGLLKTLGVIPSKNSRWK